MKENKLKNYIQNNTLDIDKLIDEYTPYIRTVIQNTVHNNVSNEDKEEIISDTFFVLWKRYKENYEIESLSSYISGIVRNLILQKLKTNKYTISIENLYNIEQIENLPIYSEERTEIEKISHKINSLKEIEIKIITMFYYNQDSIKDIANNLKISESNVKTRLHRIRKKIKKEFEKGDYKYE